MHGADHNPSLAPGKQPPRPDRALGWLTLRGRTVRSLLVGATLLELLLPEPLVRIAVAAESADVIQRRQSQMKFAYLYSFGVFTRWPNTAFDTTEKKFVIGVVGDSPFADDLNRIALTKKIQGKEILLKRIASPDQIPTCHIMYILGGVSAEVEHAVLEKLKGQPVLTVGEGKDFLNNGGVLRFFTDGAIVRFELSPNAAVKQQLTIDARLVKLGQVMPNSPKAP